MRIVECGAMRTRTDLHSVSHVVDCADEMEKAPTVFDPNRKTPDLKRA